MPEIPLQQAFEIAGQHLQAGRLGEAEGLYRQILQVLPGHPDVLHHLGIVASQMGRNEVAVEFISQALAGVAEPAAAHSNLGLALCNLGRLDEAHASLTRALELQSDYPEARSNMGMVLLAMGRIKEALANFEAALRSSPNYAEAENGRGIALSQLGRHAEALAAMQRACELAPTSAKYWYNHGTAAQAADEVDLSLVASARALALAPEDANARNNFGSALKEAGRLDEAIELYQQAWHQAQSPMAGSNAVYMLHFHPGYDAAAIGRVAREWDATFAAPLRTEIAPHENERNPQRRLRIGYVSPDFRDQAEAFFVLPLLEAHDRENFEIHCYSSVRQPDELTARHRAAASVWHEVAALSDAELAGKIRADGIDILVDLTMQMGYNRLLLFARKPAPVQVAWLAYPGTTGLATMDYRITDHFMDPVGMDESCYSEKSIRLPDSWCCYQPLGELPDPGAPPAMAAGRVTFGSLNGFYKLNHEVVALWAQAMHAVAGSRLVMLAPPGAHRERLWAQFAACGIAPERIDFLGRRPRRAYLESYRLIDIALDPFPYNGITSTCDALWMGVPVVSRTGARAAARAGFSLLSAAGRPEWVAQSDAEFVAIAAGLAANLPQLANLRRNLRESVAQSPLADGGRFAKNLESAYRDIWRTSCENLKVRS